MEWVPQTEQRRWVELLEEVRCPWAEWREKGWSLWRKKREEAEQQQRSSLIGRFGNRSVDPKNDKCQ